MMDAISQDNRARWNALARANVEYSRPFLDFTREQVAEYIYRHGVLKDVNGKNVLCLASGGGQDSVAFGLLGAKVTVLDLSDVQLERDRQGAAHHGLSVTTIHGDMRDLSVFSDEAFDVVWQVYSVNFVPSVESIFREVARVLKPGGIYFVQFANPFVQGVDEDAWDGRAYPLTGFYLDGEDLVERFPYWDVKQPAPHSLCLNSRTHFALSRISSRSFHMPTKGSLVILIRFAFLRGALV
ncbi:MAG: class I SAM-dependent methyltransferase [Anaerolineales bacterium]|nr:class I SAM-dependent methyltransferase [Anaerolineales bacterium]